MPGRRAHVRREVSAGDAPGGRAVNEQRRLGSVRRTEIVGGSFEARAAQRDAERIISLIERGLRLGECRREILPHSRSLGSLPWKKQNDVHD
jgi:hypothetical protein